MKEYHKPVLTVIGRITGSDIPFEDFILPMPPDPDRPIIAPNQSVLPNQAQDEQATKDKLSEQLDHSY